MHRPQLGVEARIRDPDAAVDADELGNRGPPSILVRLASALMYIVPWIDIIGLGRQIYHKFPTMLLLYVIPGAPSNPSSHVKVAGRELLVCYECLFVELVHAPTPAGLGPAWCRLSLTLVCACRSVGACVLQQPVCAADRLLPPVLGRRQEQQAAPLRALQLHAGASNPLLTPAPAKYFVFVCNCASGTSKVCLASGVICRRAAWQW